MIRSRWRTRSSNALTFSTPCCQDANQLPGSGGACTREVTSKPSADGVHHLLAGGRHPLLEVSLSCT
ncbi:hypothetical protein [Mariniluteicoccus endophyticus]